MFKVYVEDESMVEFFKNNEKIFIVDKKNKADIVVTDNNKDDFKKIKILIKKDVPNDEEIMKIHERGFKYIIVKDEFLEYAIEGIIKSLSEKEIKDKVLLIGSIEKIQREFIKHKNINIKIVQNEKGIGDLNDFSSIIVELKEKSDLELIKTINKNRKIKIPIIVYSKQNNSYLINLALMLGADSSVKCPVTTKELIVKIKENVKVYERRKQIIQKDKEIEEYKKALNHSTLISKTDLSGRITFVNEKFCKVSGYREDELIGKNHNIVRHPEMHSSVFKEMWETIKNKKIWEGKIKNRKKNGDFYYVHSTIIPILDYEGNIVEFLSIRKDVTELEIYKEILEEDLNIANNNLSYLKQFEDAINNFVSIIKTNQNNTITYANDIFCETSGYEKKDILGKDCRILRSEKHIKNNDCDNVQDDIKKKKQISIMFENKSKDGEKYYMDTKIYPIIDNNESIHEIVHLMYNVTDIIEVHKELEETQKDIIYRMGEIGESRSKETGNHVKRVANYSKLLAELYGLDEKDCNDIYTASPMHDIGKVAIPDAILNKPGKHTPEEWEVMKMHSEIGYKILQKSKRRILQSAAIIAHEHHEKWDGTGYPRGLREKEIHIYGRITAIADVFDALSAERCYKKAWEDKKIIEFFKEQKGKHFDPELTKLFLINKQDFFDIRNSLKD